MGEPATNLEVLREVLDLFSRLQIPHALGGSMASSLHGIARFTLDADIAAEPFADRISAFVASFGSAYYLSAAAIEEAHRRRSSFNIIHTEVGFKIDVFVRPDAPFEQSAMSRRQMIPIDDPTQAPISVQSAEDVILFKLRWYRLGQESSEQQWKDILGVVKTKAGQLDLGYLQKWADELCVADLLGRILQEAAGQTTP